MAGKFIQREAVEIGSVGHLSETPNTDGWSVRSYRDGDEPALIALFRTAFPHWPAKDIPVDAEAHLRWKLHSHPHVLAFQTIAEAGSRIIGSRLLTAMHAKAGGDILFACQGVDNAVLADYRDKGVLTAMRALNWDEFNATFDFILTDAGSHPAVQRINQHINLQPVANEVDILTRPLAPNETFVESPAPQTQRTIRTLPNFDERIDTFWEAASQPYDFIVRRTRDYLSWRYSDQRAGPFIVRAAEEHGRLVGYTVLRPSAKRGYIADILALPERNDVVVDSVNDALRFFAEQEAPAVECCLPRRHPYRGALRDLGFTQRRTLPIGYRHMRTSAEKLAFLQDERASIHLTFGDFDLV